MQITSLRWVDAAFLSVSSGTSIGEVTSIGSPVPDSQCPAPQFAKVHQRVRIQSARPAAASCWRVRPSRLMRC
jgi:hypothetical protein